MRYQQYVVGMVMTMGLIACEGQEAQIALRAADPSFLDSYVSDDPCGWDDPMAFHSTVGGEKSSRSRETFSAMLDPNVQWVQISIQADGKVFVNWRDDNVPMNLEYQGTWSRISGVCAVKLTAVSGQTLMYLGNPDLGSGGTGGFLAADVYGSLVDFVPDGRLGFTKGSGW